MTALQEPTRCRAAASHNPSPSAGGWVGAASVKSQSIATRRSPPPPNLPRRGRDKSVVCQGELKKQTQFRAQVSPGQELQTRCRAAARHNPSPSGGGRVGAASVEKRSRANPPTPRCKSRIRGSRRGIKAPLQTSATLRSPPPPNLPRRGRDKTSFRQGELKKQSQFRAQTISAQSLSCYRSSLNAQSPHLTSPQGRGTRLAIPIFPQAPSPRP